MVRNALEEVTRLCGANWEHVTACKQRFRSGRVRVVFLLYWALIHALPLAVEHCTTWGGTLCRTRVRFWEDLQLGHYRPHNADNISVVKVGQRISSRSYRQGPAMTIWWL